MRNSYGNGALVELGMDGSEFVWLEVYLAHIQRNDSSSCAREADKAVDHFQQKFPYNKDPKETTPVDPKGEYTTCRECDGHRHILGEPCRICKGTGQEKIPF